MRRQMMKMTLTWWWMLLPLSRPNLPSLLRKIRILMKHLRLTVQKAIMQRLATRRMLGKSGKGLILNIGKTRKIQAPPAATIKIQLRPARPVRKIECRLLHGRGTCLRREKLANITITIQIQIQALGPSLPARVWYQRVKVCIKVKAAASNHHLQKRSPMSERGV